MEKVLLIGFGKQFTQRASSVIHSEIYSSPKENTHYTITAVGELKRLPSFSCDTKYLLYHEGFPLSEEIKAEHALLCGMGSSCDFTLSSTGISPVDGKDSDEVPRAVLAFGKSAEVEFAQEIAFDSHMGMSPYENIVLETMKYLLEKTD